MNLTRNSGLLASALALVLLAGGGCAADTEEPDDAELDEIESGSGGEVETVVRRLTDLSVVSGAEAELNRTRWGHWAEEETRELPPGHIVTMFYVIFNDPENCTHPLPPLATCTTPDLSNPATNASALWIEGRKIGSDGRGDFDNFVRPGVSGAPGEVVFGPGLVDLYGSEIHFLTRDKGLPIAGREEEQKRTFAGGCEVSTCQDLQVGIFLRAR